ncbi:hypothetical protein CP880_08570 [Cutibacterium namnetense]|uniref:Uncharacterized protein n=1 Tax=Cutibacterium namnetense TaxID=1574624 RepID=A0ABX9I9I5_9ACTN|nr:hypothetical protein CP880_08570 [Cutibacterium namnetense]
MTFIVSLGASAVSDSEIAVEGSRPGVANVFVVGLGATPHGTPPCGVPDCHSLDGAIADG